jgi:hypothetical protein
LEATLNKRGIVATNKEAIYCHSNYGPTFGFGSAKHGYDLCLSLSEDQKCFTHIDNSFNRYNNSPYHLTSEESFEICELEVFHKIADKID